MSHLPIAVLNEN